MGVRKDLKRAKHLAGRSRVEIVTDEKGVVREARTPPLAPPPTTGSTADLPFTNAAEAPDAVVLHRRDGTGWHPVTAREFAAEVTAVAKGLIAEGLEPGGRVAVMSRTRYEWTVLDFAIWAAGGQTVPVYATSSAQQVEWIVRDSGVRHFFVETADNLATATAADHPAPDFVRYFQIDSHDLAALRTKGLDVPDEEVAKRRAALTPDTIATVCYTSGTTGRPKGCVLTHANLHAEAANTVELLHPIFKEVTDQTASTLLFLPLAHIMGRTLQIACLMARIEIGHCPSIKPDELRPALKEFRPTFLVGVPYLFEKIHATGRATAEKLGRAASFDRAHRTGVRFGAAYLDKFLGRGKGPGPGLYAAWGLYDLLVYRRIRKELGGRMRYAISGGSPWTASSTCSSPRPGSSSTRATGSPRPAPPPPSSRRSAPAPARSDSRFPAPRSASPTTARSSSRAGSSSAPTGTTPRPPTPSCGTAGSPPAISAPSTRTAISPSPAARRTSWSPPAARTSPRRSWRTGCAAGPPSASVSSSATTAPSSPP